MQVEIVEQAIKVNRAYFCLDCGKCTSVCPISWREARYSPRAVVETTKLNSNGAVLHDGRLWDCLTCGRCTQVCPSDVRFLEFVRDMRTLARKQEVEGHCSHGAAVQTWMRMMANPEIKQNRLEWLTDDLKTSEQSDTLFFVGCLPYYQVLFGKLGAQGAEIAQSAVRLLNALGIEPIVLADERCCGHDLLWEGEIDTFQKLRSLNTETLQATGAKRIVTTCPECARTLKMDYDLGVEVQYIAELAAGLELQTATGNEQRRVTFQDPCRLGRHLGEYDAPRQALENIGLQVVEMENHRGRALCCGTSAWTHCGATAKAIQVDRLQEARATGADLLVTACAKCQIHFKCAQDDPQLKDELDIEIKDLTTLIAEAIEK